jgi:O-antigen ligase
LERLRRDGALIALTIYCALFAVPLRWQVGPTTIGLLDLYVGALALWLIWHWSHVWPLLAKTPAFIPFLAFFAVSMLGLWDATDTSLFLKEAVKLAQAITLYVGIAYVMFRSREASPARAMDLWAATLLLIVLVSAVWQIRFMRATPNPFIDDDTATRYFRFGWGTFALSNYFAAMLIVVVPPLLYRLTVPAEAGRRNLWLTAPGLVIFGLALTMTFSRGAIAAMAVGMMLMCLYPTGGRARRTLVFLATAASVVAVALAFPTGRRLFDFSSLTIDEISNDRTYRWREAISEISERPILGAGLGNLSMARFERSYAHNAYLQLAGDSGLLGAMFYLLFIGAVGWTTFLVSWSNIGKPEGWVFHGAAIVLVVTLMHNLVENTIVGGVLFTFLYWPTQGLVLAKYWASDSLPVRGA